MRKFRLCACGCGDVCNAWSKWRIGHASKDRVLSASHKAAIKAGAIKSGIKPPQLSIELNSRTKGMKLRPHSEEARKRVSESCKNSPKTHAHIACMKIDRKGPGNPAWRGGRSLLPYAYTWKHELKEQVRSRHGHHCAICHGENKGKNLDVHHLNEDKMDCRLDNLIALCHPCHQRVTMNNWVLAHAT